MGRAPCCEKVGLKRGRWTAEEDETLMKYIQANGEGSWRSLPKNAGLLRCGKSCRLRWINYLRADLKRGNISSEEEEMIIKLHSSLGNRWSLIAGHLPGRTDNEIKNYWNSHLSRRIHTFRRPISTSEPLTRVVMDLAKLNTVGPIIKRKGGRTSRASMKKNKKIISSLKNPKLMPPPPSSSILDQEKTNEDEEKEGSGYEGMTNDVLITHKSNQGKETLISAIEEQVEERESMVLDSYEEGEERESVLTSGHCRDSTGGGISEERENLILYNEEIESGFLMCPTYVEPAAGLLGPNNNGISMDIDQGMGTRSTGILNTFGTDDHERGNGMVSSLINSSTSSTTTTTTSSNDDQAAGGKKISSISAAGGDDHENWQFLYSSSCFDQDDWVHKNWDWNNWEAGSHVVEEDHLNVWGEKEEEMLSWLWESDHDNDIGGGGGLGGTTGDETLFKECEKQQALNAWLLS